MTSGPAGLSLQRAVLFSLAGHLGALALLMILSSAQVKPPREPIMDVFLVKHSQRPHARRPEASPVESEARRQISRETPDETARPVEPPPEPSPVPKAVGAASDATRSEAPARIEGLKATPALPTHKSPPEPEVARKPRAAKPSREVVVPPVAATSKPLVPTTKSTPSARPGDGARRLEDIARNRDADEEIERLLQEDEIKKTGLTPADEEIDRLIATRMQTQHLDVEVTLDTPLASGGRVSPEDILKDYVVEIERALYASWEIPREVRLAGMKAEVRIGLQLDGTVLNPTIMKTSGSGKFDASVLEATVAASPLPPPPGELNVREVVITFTPVIR